MTTPALDFRLDAIRDDAASFDRAAGTRDAAVGRTHPNTPPDDSHLLARLHAGDASAMTVIFDRYLDPLLRFAESILVAGGDPNDAADVVSDVLATLWERRATVRDVHNVRAYLYRAVHHRAVDHRRAARRATIRYTTLAAAGEPPGMASRSPAADDAMETSELQQLVWRTVNEMREPLRTVAILRWSHGMGFADIAASLDCSEGAARVHAGRALTILRTALPRLLR